ncbi:MAG TPA: hypothetical protein VJO16_04110 [Candidatus Acidoferrum sp.]|nr:hypothetical protein [Candidatus Acidoferrum sp.]
MKSIPCLLLSGFLILPNSVSLAQTPQPPAQQPQRPPDGGTREVLISILIPSKANAPFTATVNTEWIRQLPDGSAITLKNHRAIARDAAGRIFQERRALVPDDVKVASGVTQIEISDPVAHELYICMPYGQTCQLEEFSPREPATYGAPGKPHMMQGSSVESEGLGKQSIGGIETVGTRETTIIPANSIGNNSPLMLKREFWYSPQLGVNLISKLQHPLSGTQNFEVSDITLGEPDAKLFAPPAGFKILDLRKPQEMSEAARP